MLLRMLLLMVVNVINTLRLFNRFIRKMVCWFVGWWFEFWLLCRFLVLRDVWQKCWNLNARIHSKIVLKIYEKTFCQFECGISVWYFSKWRLFWISVQLFETILRIDAWILVNKNIKIIKNNTNNPSKIGPKSFQNRPKTIPDRWKCVLGAFSAPNRAQVGSRTLPVRSGTDAG